MVPDCKDRSAVCGGGEDWGKDTAAMKVAATAAEENLPDVGSLLREGSFQQRMEAARKQRERVLAMRAAEAGDQSDLVVVHRPWGRQGWEAPQPRQLADPPAAEVVLPLLSDVTDTNTGASRLPALAAASESPAAQTEGAKRRGFIIARTSWGFALGLGLGIAVATAIPYLRSQNAPGNTASLPAPAVSAPTAEASPSPVTASATPSRDPVQDDSAVIILPGHDASAQPVTPVFGVTAATDILPTADIAAEPILKGLSDWLPQSSVGPVPDTSEQGYALAPGDKPMDARTAPPMPDMPQLVDLPVAEQTPPPATSAVVGPDYSATGIHILLSKGGNVGDASPLAAKLDAAGFTVTETAETGVTIRETNVRYYHLADAEAAQALAARLGVTARDFTGFSPTPPQGMIEVWVQGPATDKAPAVVVKKTKTKAKKKPAAPAADPAISEAQELQALRDRLLKQLQAGASP